MRHWRLGLKTCCSNMQREEYMCAEACKREKKLIPDDIIIIFLRTPSNFMHCRIKTFLWHAIVLICSVCQTDCIFTKYHLVNKNIFFQFVQKIFFTLSLFYLKFVLVLYDSLDFFWCTIFNLLIKYVRACFAISV